MAKECILGIDIGTSACKSIIVDNEGNLLASATEEYPLYTPFPGWAEQNPSDWWNATINTMKKAIQESNISPASIKCVGLSGQMHGLVALDKNHEVIRPAFLWNDQRTLKQCLKIIEIAGGESQLLNYTNNTMLPGYTGGKILWLKEEEPQNYEKSKIFLNPKDYIRYRMTGEIATEVSDASGTGLFDVKNRKWSTDLLQKLGIDINLLPLCYESPEITGFSTKEVFEATGLPQKTAVAGGGGDAVIQTIGSGLIKEGVLGLTIGTAGIIAMGLNSFKFNSTGKFQVFCNNAPDKWYILGVTLAAGGSLQWFKNNMCKYEIDAAKAAGNSNVYTILEEAIEKESPPGSNNLVFLPYLIGERCPYPDPNARGVFLGVTLRHKHSDFTRSIMEGVSFSMKQIYGMIVSMDTNLSVSEIRISGGGSGSSMWRKMIADIFQLPVKTVSGSKEGGAFGAALVAGAGAGIWNSVEEATNILKIETEVLPDTKNSSIYNELFEVYKELYPLLKPTFDKLSQIK
ncbi:MAG: xylulokinase [Actinomycetota bacterium]